MEAGTPDLVKLEDLEASRQLTGRKHILSLLVENKPGVLARIAGLFSRRGFNIDTLAVGLNEAPDTSRITITLDGAVHPIDQVTKQLHKLVHVIKIRDLAPSETVSRELALFKISCQDGDARAQVMQFTDIFRGNVVDVHKRSVTVEITGTDDKIESFEDLRPPQVLMVHHEQARLDDLDGQAGLTHLATGYTTADLSLSFWQPHGLDDVPCLLGYATARFDPATAQRLASDLLHLLGTLTTKE